MGLYRDGYTSLLATILPEYNQSLWKLRDSEKAQEKSERKKLREKKATQREIEKSERRRVSEVNRGGPIPSFRNVSLENKQWLTGFVEGDGCIALPYPGHPVISISQKDRRVLYFVQDMLGAGSLYYGDGNEASQLVYGGLRRCLPILEAVSPYLVAQHTVNRIVEVFDIRYEPGVPALSWIVGFWDAEGCFFIGKYNDLHASLSQLDSEVLEKVQRVIGGRIMDGAVSQLYLRKSELLDFLPIYLKYSHNIEKQERLTCVLQKRIDWLGNRQLLEERV